MNTQNQNGYMLLFRSDEWYNELSLEELWMPFTANRAFKRAPRLLASASGMYYTSVDGRRVLDGTAGLWCVNAGHCRQPIVRAVQEAAAIMVDDFGHRRLVVHEVPGLCPPHRCPGD